jgi:type II secretion system protein G
MKTTTKSAFHRGFTLIELMIVIVILGILMGTILPRLSGAQGRARDTARVADLNAISQALETYFNDFGSYPGTNGTVECLSESSTNSGSKLAIYLKGGKIPTPPSATQQIKIGSTTCTGQYAYAPINSRGVSAGGYMLATDVETFQNANYNLSSLPSIDNAADVTDFSPVKGTTLQSVDASNAANTIYVLVN